MQNILAEKYHFWGLESKRCIEKMVIHGRSISQKRIYDCIWSTELTVNNVYLMHSNC